VGVSLVVLLPRLGCDVEYGRSGDLEQHSWFLPQGPGQGSHRRARHSGEKIIQKSGSQ
jgi:hypothetical protein